MSEIQTTAERASGYSAPALEKGLDILELLAGEEEPLSQSQIASRLDRSISEIFRMLAALERRGYVRRCGIDAGYVLTLKLFELSIRHPTMDRILSAARQEMRALSEQTGQSCHLSVLDGDAILVIARAEAPTSRTFSVKTGAGFSLTATASGRVLLAFLPAAEKTGYMSRQVDGPEDAPPDGGLEIRLDAIAAQGYEENVSDAVQGVVDLSCPVLGYSGTALAALTVPFLHMKGNKVGQAEALAMLRACADRISVRLGGIPRR
ncbi:DNA-binding IclR family transcriptional regulator [Skermanella aerolata]|uniref:IclR family transcriptional regulator n=1 Tax=Skermanella aerolata TaxID=393310 RepID=UPI003D1A0204